MPESSIGAEIVLGCLALLVAGLAAMAKRIFKEASTTEPSPDKILEVVCENSRSLDALATQVAQFERAQSQLIQSLDANVTRQFAERKEAEYHRRIKALEEELDRVRRGGNL